MMRVTPSVRFDGIQILRGYLALSVLFGHAVTSIIATPLGHWVFFKTLFLLAFNPWSAVTVFFVISGFVLAHGIARIPEFKFEDYSKFLIRRLLRLLPVAWAGVGLAMLYTFVVPVRTTALLSEFFNSQGGSEFIPSLTAYYFSLYILAYDQSLWSITVEIGASLFIPALTIVVLRGGLSVFGHIVVVIALVIIHDIMIKIGFNWFAYLFSFYIGIVAYSALPSLLRQKSPLRFASMIAGAIIVFLGGWLFMNYGTPEWRVAQHVIISAGAAILLCSIASFDIDKSRVAVRIGILFGDMSYSFYAFHLVVLHFLYMQTYPLLVGSVGPLTGGSLMAASIGYALAATAITIPLAYISFRLIENPSKRAIASRPTRRE